jgi:hypothetical protein
MPETIAQKKICCPACGAGLIQKSRLRLIVVGLCMMASIAIAFDFPIFWGPGIILVLTGIYLLLWATIAKGRWCRNCKEIAIDR